MQSREFTALNEDPFWPLRHGYWGYLAGILAGGLLLVLGLRSFGWLTPDPDQRYVERHYRLYQVKRFVYLMRRDHPTMHKMVAMFLGDSWNKGYCGAAYLERKAAESRLERREIELTHGLGDTNAFAQAWAVSGLGPYTGYSLRDGGRNLQVILLPKDLEKVKALVAAHDRPH